MSQPWLYMFKASGLQDFIFATNRLKHAIGASQMILQLTEHWLVESLKSLDVSAQNILQNAAGQGAIRFDDEATAQRFASIWPLLCSVLAPGLDMRGALVELGDDYPSARMRAEQELRAQRNTINPRLPIATPATLRAPLSGQPAVKADRDDGLLDESMVRKLSHTQSILKPEDVNPNWASELDWSTDTEVIAKSERGLIAIIHIDGNGLGRFLMGLREKLNARGVDVVSFYRELSSGLSSVTKSAVVVAVHALDLAPVMGQIPFRPLIIGGDDVTVLTRDCDALPFCETFLAAFERKTHALFNALSETYKISLGEHDGLTACAGIVYQKSRSPLLTGYALCEELCSYAKRKLRGQSGAGHSGVMFARALDHSHEDLMRLMDDDFVHGQTKLCLSAGPYTTSYLNGRISIQQLSRVSATLKPLASGGVRGLIDQLQLSAEEATLAYERMKEVAGSHGRALDKELRQIVEDASWSAGPLSLLPDAAILLDLQ